MANIRFNNGGLVPIIDGNEVIPVTKNSVDKYTTPDQLAAFVQQETNLDDIGDGLVRKAFTQAERTKLSAIEAGADTTTETKVRDAGAVMKTDYNAHTVLAATVDDLPVPLTVNPSSFVGRSGAGNIAALTAAQARTILNVENGADVTNGARVGTSIQSSTPKVTPVDADTLPILDSAAANVLKKITWANIKNALRAYLDPLYLGPMEEHIQAEDNPHGVDKIAVGLGNVDNYATASQVEAEAGALNNRFMTPLRTAQAISQMAPGGGDMTKATYDPDNDGRVTWANYADTAGEVDWSDVQNASGVVVVGGTQLVSTDDDNNLTQNPKFWVGQDADLPGVPDANTIYFVI